MRVSPKQERSQIRTIEQLLRRYDLEAIASIKAATENNVTGLNKTMATLEQFIDATVGSLENMQSQIDGSISTWFYEGEPTLENSPANEWISDTEKQAHLGDLYYDKDTGYGYRFSVTEDTYEWIKITDSDVVEALAVANAAQDTADGKRRVFVAKPKPPYDEGDLWFNDEEIYICCVTKTTGEYVEDDFIIATKYTDDTKALEVEKNLNLVVARVDILQTTALTAESAVIRELQTNMLTSESAIIKELQTQVTKTETLIFGAAGGTSIQTEFSNAVIAMLGDAQIKSAMIDSVSASKVTSGTILTNDVTIQSEDGKTVLKDNTLQISDGTKVRVQIGKDASGDYSINVWDASGNLMFSEGGITDSAIKEAIIRDDMVSDNANINAAKLDIDSLFEEINGSSKTINSTKVYFDSEKQTLDVLFKSMTTEVSELQNTQSSQGTQLTVIQGQITSKVWQSDIDTAVNGVESDITALSTKYNSLNQTVNGLSSTVGDHTTSISSLGTKVASNESNITQLSNEIALKVDADGIITAINLSKETAKINAKYIDLEGAVTFSSFDEATQTKINTASSNANSALTTANTASTNATSALNRATYHYGTCSTASGTVAKAVTLSGFSLYTGAMVSVYFTYANTAASPTLNVNGTGAKSIRVNNAAITSKYYWRAKDTVTFVYNGTYWVIADSSANSLLASWCSDNDKTLIDGGKIYVNEAFAQEIFSKDITATGQITATNLLITGNSVFEGTLNGATGNFEGEITATSFQFVDDSDNLLREVRFLPQDIMLSITDNNYATPAYYTSTIELTSAGGLILTGRNMVFYDFAEMSFTGNATFTDIITARKVCTQAGADLDELNSKFTNIFFKPESLITGMIIDSIPRTYSTYNGRKFSDYNIIVFTFGVNENDIRTQIITSIGSNNEYSNTVEYAPSCYTDKLHQVVFKIESDTYISIYKASGSMSYVEVWGLKL